MPNLLFIGTPQDAIPAMAHAIGLGFGVYAVDGDKSSKGLAWVKKWGSGCDISDVYDFHWIHKTVIKNSWQVDGVIAVGTDVGPVVSLVAHALGLPHVPYSISKLSWNKIELKKVLFRAGLSVPGFAEIVVKPPDGRGSRGVSIISASNLWGTEWEAAKRESPTGRVMCEEWIEGDGVSVEAIVWNGKPVIWGATDRIYGSSQTVEIGGQSPSRYTTLLRRCSLVKRVIEAVGIKMGSIKLDLIFRGEEPIVIEAAIGRLSGGLTCSHYIPLACNIDFLAMAFSAYCGYDPEPLLYNKPFLKTNRIPGEFYYFVSGRYEMPPNPASNGSRGKFRLRLGWSREEAERKLNYGKNNPSYREESIGNIKIP